MAVTKYLDKTGLIYFWSKIKAWCNNLFALDSAVVHKTGDETINGNKTLNDTILFSKGMTTVDGSSFTHLQGGMANNDYWQIRAGATSNDNGFLEIRTGDNGTEPIYVKQYNNSAGSERTLTLLDASGNSAFPGSITATTPATSDNSTKVATTAFVKAQGYLTSHQTLPSLSLTTSGSGNAITALSVSGHAITATKGTTFLTSHQSLADYAKLASPAFTGTPTAPTASASTNNTQIATTAFVKAQGYVTANNKVKQVSGTGNSNRPILVRYNAADASETDNYAVYNDGVTINTSTCKLTASGGFVGNVTGNCSGSSGSCTGNAATATKLGTSTVGSVNNPIYLNGGTPTATDSVLVKRIKQSVSNGNYADMIQTVQSDNNDYRSCTIRCINGSGYNELLLGAHNEADDAPSGISIKNTAGTVIATAPAPAADANDTRIATTKWVKDRAYITSSSNITGTSANVTGTVAIANGGTGATTRLNAVKALTNENVGSGANYFLTITTSWGKAGYTSIADAKTALGLGSAAYTASTAYAAASHTHSYVAKSGDTMTGALQNSSYYTGNSFYIKNNEVTKGTNPASGVTRYWTFGAEDKDGINYTNNCLGMLETSLNENGTVRTYIRAIENTAASTNNMQFTCVYDKANNRKYAECNSEIKITSNSQNQLRMIQGNYGVFFRNDGSNFYLLQTASGDATFGSWTTARPLTVNLSTGVCSINGNAVNVTGTVAIANGGTGATTRLNAVKALTNEAVGSSATHFLTITTNWAKAGYSSVADVKTVLGLGSAAYTASTAYATASHTHSYLPLSGGTLTGSVNHVGLVYKSTTVDRADTTTDSNTELWPYTYNDKNGLALGNYGLERGYKSGYNRLRFRLRNTGNKWADLIFQLNDDNEYYLYLTGISGTSSSGFHGDITGIVKGTINLAAISTQPSSDTYKTIWECYAKDDKIVADSYVGRSTNGSTAIALRSRCSNGTSTNHAYLHLWCNSDGSTRYVSFPTPATTSNTDTGATTAWVRTFCDTTQKYMKAVSVTGSGNAVTTASLSNGTLTLTKGTTFLTSHQSLSNYVDRSTAQEVSGNKKFMSGIERWGDNAHIKIFNTGITNYNTTPTAEKSSSFGLHANDSNVLASFGIAEYTDGKRSTYIRCYQKGSTSSYRSVNLSSVTDAFFPGVTKQLTLGRSDRLWTTVYAQTGSINTSDKRLKQQINKIPDNILDAWEGINWIQYKFNDSVEEKGLNEARTHTGLIAQDIDDVFKKKKLNISQYGLFCYNEWEASPPERNDDNEICGDGTPAGNQYSIRYEEALCMEAAYQRRKNKILEKRISDLEEQLSSVLEILNNLKGA